MEFVIPENTKSAFTHLPIGTLAVRVTDVREDMIGNESPTYGIVADLEVTEPDEAAGMTSKVTFFIGTKDDRGSLEERVKPETFAARGGKFLEFCDKAGVSNTRGGNLEVVLSELRDRTLKGRTIAKKNPTTYQFGAKKGQPHAAPGRYNVEWSMWMSNEEGPQPSIQTTVAQLEASENNGSAGQPHAAAPVHAQVSAPPPPPAPGARTAMPRTGSR